jgi:hypothetical protein
MRSCKNYNCQATYASQKRASSKVSLSQSEEGHYASAEEEMEFIRLLIQIH